MINSKIEWCHHTINLWWGCVEVHEGCDKCYAKLLAKRWGYDIWGTDKLRRIIDSAFENLDKLQRLAESSNEIHRVFVGSMMDIFEKPMPVGNPKTGEFQCSTGDLRNEFFRRISKGRYPNLIFLLLTKRPSNINKYIPKEWKSNPPRNVMFGTSVVNQKTCRDLIPKLLGVNGYRFLSVEPQLSLVRLGEWLKTEGIHWVIQGGESGPKRRPFDLAWGRSLRDECASHGTAYFFKQVDKVLPIPDDLMVREFYEEMESVSLL